MNWLKITLVLLSLPGVGCGLERARREDPPSAELNSPTTPAPSAEPASPPPPPTTPRPSLQTGCPSWSAVSLVPGVRGLKVFNAACGEAREPSVLVRFADGRERWSPLPPDLARGGWNGCGGASEAMPGGFLVGLWFCHGRWGEPWRALFIEVREEHAELRFVHSLQTPRRADVRMKDLDADGVPEVRIGRRSPEGERRIETFRLAGDGFEPWSGEPVGPWVAAARATCAEHAEGSPGCDPILDVETSSEPLPGGRTAVLAEGPRAECGTAGCPVSAWLVLPEGHVTRILDDFGSIGFGVPRPAKEPPCIFIDGAVSRRYCWDGQAFRHVQEGSGSEE